MSRYNPDFTAEPVFEAAELWKEKCLLNGGSLFSERNLWNLGNIKELMKHFVNNPDELPGRFWDKFEKQLGPASKSAKLFASEIIYIYCISPVADIIRKQLLMVLTEFAAGLILKLISVLVPSKP